MAAPGFGFSVGDFIAGAQILVRVIDAFKGAGGASSKYAKQVSFLQGFKATLEHLERHVKGSSPSDLSDDILKLLDDMRRPWNEFKTFLLKYDRALGQIASKPAKANFRKIPQVIQFTMNDISGKAEKLRREIQEPLAAVNSLLLLHLMESLRKLPDQTLRPDQCAQLVEAIRMADIPAELDKQIRVLKRTAYEHNVKQDEQLEIIKTLRTQLGGLMSTLQISLDGMRRNKSVESPQDSRQDVGRLASLLEGQVGSLETTMKDQEHTIEELKSFLEDKASKQKADKIQSHGSSNSWPSATISAAYFAALLLSTVVSTCTATTLINRQPQSYQHTRPRNLHHAMFLPPGRSLPVLGASDHHSGQNNTIAGQSDMSTNRTASARQAGLTTKDRSKWTNKGTASQWARDFSSQETVQVERVGRGGDFQGDGRGMSKLEVPSKGGDGERGHRGGDGLVMEPGPVTEPYEGGTYDEQGSEDASDNGNIWDESESFDSSDSHSDGGDSDSDSDSD